MNKKYTEVAKYLAIYLALVTLVAYFILAPAALSTTSTFVGALAGALLPTLAIWSVWGRGTPHSAGAPGCEEGLNSIDTGSDFAEYSSDLANNPKFQYVPGNLWHNSEHE